MKGPFYVTYLREIVVYIGTGTISHEPRWRVLWSESDTLGETFSLAYSCLRELVEL